MPFKPGISGNPGGRPRLTETVRQIQELAKEKSAAALDVLEEISLDKDAPLAARASAASAILDRAWGRSAQASAGTAGLPATKITIGWLSLQPALSLSYPMGNVVDDS